MDELGLQSGMRLIPRCEDPELSVLERAWDGTQAILAALLHIVLVVALIPVWIPGATVLGIQHWICETDAGEKVGAVMDRIKRLWAPFKGVFTLQSDGDVLGAARVALTEREAEALKRALMQRGFMGLRAIRPRDKGALLSNALQTDDPPLDMCDVIVNAGCRVRGFWPNVDVLLLMTKYGHDITKIRWALSHRAHPGSNRTVWSRSVIEGAIHRRDLDLVKMFEEKHPMGTWGKRRAVRLTAELGVNKILEWMLSHPDWQKAVSTEFICRTRPTLLMEGACHLDCVKVLLPRSRPNQASYSHELALFRLCRGRLFLRVSAGPLAMERRSSESVELVTALHESGCNIKESNWNGETLLHQAAGGAGGGDVIPWLLSQGFDPLARDECGETPLMWAARIGCVINLRALISVSDVHAKNKKGRSALMILASSELSRYYSWDRDGVACGEALIAAGSDPQQRDNKGLRAVDLAAGTAKAELFNMLSLRSSWNPESVEKILDSRAVRKMERPREVSAIRVTTTRLREVVEIEAAVPVLPAPIKARRL